MSRPRVARSTRGSLISWVLPSASLHHVVVASGFEQGTPRLDLGTTAQQCTPFALGHAAPDTELGSVVQGVGKAFGANRAAQAYRLGPVLRRTGNEQFIWFAAPARRQAGPIIDPRHTAVTPVTSVNTKPLPFTPMSVTLCKVGGHG